ncbi:hypothetical protein VNO80_27105 [Phaseolus coccineus]|uniref:Small ribosomal subunit protein uS5 C-terminal domain-containing protein n=1 Tax=Phaseolus coccineus TaxID=3886 RepID=A0AAN9LG89_PHACN
MGPHSRKPFSFLFFGNPHTNPSFSNGHGGDRGHERVGLSVKYSKEVATVIPGAIILVKFFVIPCLGIVATRVPKKVLQFTGIIDVFTSSRGSTKTLSNFSFQLFVTHRGHVIFSLCIDFSLITGRGPVKDKHWYVAGVMRVFGQIACVVVLVKTLCHVTMANKSKLAQMDPDLCSVFGHLHHGQQHQHVLLVPRSKLNKTLLFHSHILLTHPMCLCSPPSSAFRVRGGTLQD